MTPPAALARRGTGRIAWIDVSRGWCMLAIVAGHFYLPWNQHPALFDLLYAFHVPAFFFLSGLVFNPGKRSFPRFLYTRVRAIMLPYVLWAFISVCIFAVLGSVAAGSLGRKNPASFTTMLKDIMWATPSAHHMDWNKPLWFLPAIMIAYLIAWATAKLIEGNRIALAVITVISLLPSWFLASHQEVWYPWSFERVGVLMPFFFLGMYMRPIVNHLPIKYPLIEGLDGIGLLAIAAAISHYNTTTVDYVARTYGNYANFVAAALVGIAGICMISRAWNIDDLTRIGKMTLGILCTHKFIVLAVQIVINSLGMEELITAMGPIPQFVLDNSLSVGFAWIITAACFAVCIALKYLAPWSIGLPGKGIDLRHLVPKEKLLQLAGLRMPASVRRAAGCSKVRPRVPPGRVVVVAAASTQPKQPQLSLERPHPGRPRPRNSETTAPARRLLQAIPARYPPGVPAPG